MPHRYDEDAAIGAIWPATRGRRCRSRHSVWPVRSPLVAAAAIVVLAGCRPDTVRLAYDPAPGTTTSYEVRVRTETVLDLEGRARSKRTQTAVLRVRQRVLPGERRVEVRLERPGSPPRTFVARLDPSAHVSGIESVEGLPVAVLGDVGLAELVPAAAPVVPDRPLRPGERWTIDQPLRLPGSPPSRLRGTGRLVELGVVDDVDTPTVRASTPLAVRRVTTITEGRVELDGRQVSDTTTRHVLADGTVVSGRSTTVGTFAVSLAPPGGAAASALDGTLRVTVRSDVRRVDA